MKKCNLLVFVSLSCVLHNNVMLQLEDILFDKDIEER